MINYRIPGFPPTYTRKMAAEFEEEREFSELEERAWEEKKRTRERVSSIMGQYLLKGYRMLNVNCEECENILLQTREGANYCVYCSEVVKQANSAEGNTQVHLSTTALSSAWTPTKTSISKASTEHKVPTVCTGRTSDTFKLTTTPADHDTMTMCSDIKRTGMRTNPAVTHTSKPTDNTQPQDKPRATPIATNLQSTCTEASFQCQTELVSKLKWCTSELEKTQSPEHAILLCRLITATGEALKTLQGLPTPTTSDLSMET